MTWVNAIVQGVLLGGFYALLACGLSLMFGVMRIINLAHGDIAVVGAYLVWVLATSAFDLRRCSRRSWSFPPCGSSGTRCTCCLLERSRRAGLLVPLLTTFGLAIVIENVLLQVFSPDVHSLLSSTGSLATASVTVGGGLAISALGTLIFATAVVVLTGLQLFLARTNAGRQMRATAEDPDAAELVGINARAVYARGHCHRRRDRCTRRHVSRDPFDIRSVDGTDAAHLRVRGCRHRRVRLGVGDAGRWHRARRRPGDRRAGQPAVRRALRSSRLPGGACRAACRHPRSQRVQL